MSETGHPVNLANFGKLLTAVQGMGPRYSPASAALSVGNLEAIQAANKTAVQSLKDAVAANKTVINSREALFAPVDTLTRRIIKSASSAGATEAQLADMETIARKIKGERAGTKNPAPVNPGDPKSVSVSQQSFVHLAAHLDNLISVLETIPAYNPNEQDLQLPALRALQGNMETANEQASAADYAENTARTARNAAMYGEKTGLVDVAADVKDYIFSSSNLGAKNPDYIAIKSIPFTRNRK